MPEWAGDRGVLGKANRLAGFENHLCHPIQWEETIETDVDDLDGTLLKIVPYQGSDGVRSGVELARALHEEFSQPVNSFEVWFDEGYIHFYIYAATEDAAETIRRKVRNWYPNAQIITVKEGRAFPTVHEDEWISGAMVTKENPLDFLPIRCYDDAEWEHDDPYKEVLGNMISDDETRVVMQSVMKAIPKSWTEGGGRHGSVEHVANDLESDDVRGWIPRWTIREVPASETEKMQADIVRKQDRKPAFEVNFRILAISHSPQEAANRVQGTGSAFSTYYDTEAKQGLKSVPVTAMAEFVQRTKMQKHINRMQNRTLESNHSCYMTFKEWGGTSHIPSGDIPTKHIKWRQTRSGSEIPRDAPGRDRFS